MEQKLLLCHLWWFLDLDLQQTRGSDLKHSENRQYGLFYLNTQAPEHQFHQGSSSDMQQNHVLTACVFLLAGWRCGPVDLDLLQ